MNYEQKYKEALERAKIAHKDEDRHLKATLERIFPELEESKDERIRKALCKAIWTYVPTEEGQEYIAWLEKQGKNGWSEKDIKMIDSIIEEVRPCGECPDYSTDEERDYFYKGQDRVEWLERLKKSDNAKWWPSELQLNCLSK